MKLIKLRDEDINKFKKYMRESFQYGYESVYGKDKSQVLPEKDIDKSLNNPQCHSYEMIDDNNEIIGGAIVGINENNIRYYFIISRICASYKRSRLFCRRKLCSGEET